MKSAPGILFLLALSCRMMMASPLYSANDSESLDILEVREKSRNHNNSKARYNLKTRENSKAPEGSQTQESSKTQNSSQTRDNSKARDSSKTRDNSKTFISEVNQFVSQHTEGQWFLGYQYGDLNRNRVNLFTLKRGYVTFKSHFSDRWSVRFTQDITLDQEGIDRGNVELRLKYCYVNYETGDFWFFTDPALEAGLVHRPWLDYEQSINPYRVQGTMFLERAGLINSADFGLTFSALLGGKMSDRYQQQVNDEFPGRYGSLAIGIYNGGGYHALENNQSKNLEARLSLRPFPGSLPGLQFTYNMAWGKGNAAFAPDFSLHSGFVSYERQHLALTAQYYSARGNSHGSYLTSRGMAAHNEGYSFFTEYEIPQTPWTLFARYDYFDCGNMDISDSRRMIYGVGYYFYNHSKLVVDFDALDRGINGEWENQILEVALDIQF